MYDDPCPVHTDKDVMNQWVSDDLTWQDVYSKKPVEYLEAIARGEVPRWDSEAKKYVYGDDATEVFGGTPVDPQAGMSPDEELPF